MQVAVDDPAAPRRSHRQPQGEGRAVRGNGGGAGRARAGRILAAAADRADTARPAARSPDVAGRNGRALRPAVRAHGARGARHAGVYSHITPRMRAGLNAGLQESWQRSLHERSRLAPRSAVAVVDGLLAPYRGSCSKIGSRFAPRIGHTEERNRAVAAPAPSDLGLYWGGRGDLNPRHPGPQPGALPN